MKQGLTLLLLIFSFVSFSQSVPQKINYQGVLRSPNGNPIAGKQIGLKLRIMLGTTQVSSETHVTNTNALGLFNVIIGDGNGSNLSGVSWGSNTYSLEVSADTSNTIGSNYIFMGTQQLVSVPYAMYAQSAGSAPSPTLNFTNAGPNSVLTVGSNTIGVPLSSTSIITYGALSSTLVGSTYNINTPSVTVSAATSPFSPTVAFGLAQVTGAFPNYSVLVAPVISYSPSVGTLSLTSIANTLPAYNYTYDITPQVSLQGNTLTVGPPSNSVALNTAGSTPITTLNIGAGGAGTITSVSTNNFSITVPPTNIVGSSPGIVSGSYPNYTITSGGAPSVVTGSGTALPVVSANSNTYNVSVPAVTLVTTGAITQVNTYPTISLNVPSVTVVDNPTVGFAHVSGAFPNYTVTVAPSFNYNPATGSLVVANTFSPSLSYTFNITPTLTLTSGVLSSGPGTNSVQLPTSPPPVITGAGAATVNTSVNNFTVGVPITNIVSAGGATVTSAYPNFTVNAPQQVSLTPVGGGITSVGGAYPNLTLNSPSVVITPSLPLLGTNGLLQKSGTFPNFNLYVAPDISYNPLTGSLTLQSFPLTSPTYSYNYNITPNLSITNNVIRNGPTTNTVAIISPPALALTGVNSLGILVLNTATQLSGNISFTKISTTSEVDIYLHCLASNGGFTIASNITYELRIDGNASTISSDHTATQGSQTDNITLRAVFAGLTAGSHTVSVWARTNAGFSTGVILDPNATGKIILKETY